jgi:ABC-type glutathione transport system ATPase component
MNDRPLVLENFAVSLGPRLLFDIENFAPDPGSSTAIIGKTGSGKSVLLRALSGLLPASPFSIKGEMILHGRSAYRGGVKTGRLSWRRIMAAGLVYVPAESSQSLNPALTIEQNQKLLAPEAGDLIERRLRERFRIEFGRFARHYPDEVSGGELQRITLMILLARKGGLVFLDEPTVNLDRQLRGRFIEFLNDEILGDRTKTVLVASHDFDFVRALNVDSVLSLENHTLNRLSGVPESQGFERSRSAKESAPGLSLRDVAQRYTKRLLLGEAEYEAFRGLCVEFEKSTIYGITGPSGCGKTSMIRAILRLIDGTSGRIELDGMDLVRLKPDERGRDPRAFIPFRGRMAIVQQDSRFAFFPDLRISESIRQIEAARARGGLRDRRRSLREREDLERCMDLIGLPRCLLDAYPRSLSSGEMKRMDIARAIASKPEVFLLDEPFAHIDFATRGLVMKALTDYMADNETILIVVTHEDYDLKYFVETSYDFLSLSSAG